MRTQLSHNLVCVQMRSGVEIWLEADKAETLQEALQNISQSKFIRHEGQTINTADIVGVFNASTMAEHTRRKNGEWQCSQAVWHKRNEKCACTRQVACNWCNSLPCQCEFVAAE